MAGDIKKCVQIQEKNLETRKRAQRKKEDSHSLVGNRLAQLRGSVQATRAPQRGKTSRIQAHLRSYNSASEKSVL